MSSSPNDAAFKIKRTFYLHNCMYQCAVENADLDRLELALDTALQEAAALRQAPANARAVAYAHVLKAAVGSILSEHALKLIEERVDAYAASLPEAPQPATQRIGHHYDDETAAAVWVGMGDKEPLSETASSGTAKVPEGWKLLKDSTFNERSWAEDASHENGNYSCLCCNCGRTFTGHKRRVLCKVCAAPSPTGSEEKP